MHGRVYAYLVSVLVIGAVAWPLTWKPTDDSFPLSTYPMFSRKRPTPAVVVQYAVGLTEAGERRRIPPERVGTREVLQARATIGRAVAGGRRTTQALCERIAAAVARAGDPADVREIRIVTGTHDAVAYLTGRDRVGHERVHGRCRLEHAP